MKVEKMVGCWIINELFTRFVLGVGGKDPR